MLYNIKKHLRVITTGRWKKIKAENIYMKSSTAKTGAES